MRRAAVTNLSDVATALDVKFTVTLAAARSAPRRGTGRGGTLVLNDAARAALPIEMNYGQDFARRFTDAEKRIIRTR